MTLARLRKAVRMRPAQFDMAMQGLVAKGLVVLEPLGDVTYVRPLASTRPPPPPRPPEENDPAFM